MKKLIVPLLLCIATIGTASAEWKPLTHSNDFDTYYDPATLRTNGKYREGWFMTDYRGTAKEAGKKRYMSTKYKVRFDCAQEKSLDLTIVAYAEPMGQGEVIESVSQEDTAKWQHIIPDSNGAITYKYACRK